MTSTVQAYKDSLIQEQTLKAMRRGIVDTFCKESFESWLNYWKDKLTNDEEINLEFQNCKTTHSMVTVFESQYFKDTPTELVDEFYSQLLNCQCFSILTISKVDNKLNFTVTSNTGIRF